MDIQKNDKIQPSKIMEKTIVQTNPLVEARKKMNVTEMRLFVLGLQGIKPYIKDGVEHDIEFPETLISSSELEEIFRFTSGVANVRRQIEHAFDGKIIIHYNNGGFELNHIYQTLKYEPGVGLHIKFDDKMKPYILSILNQQYTSYQMKEIFPLSSEYAWRIMELLQEKRGYFDKGEDKVYVETTLEDLRFYLNVPEGAYEGRMSNFRRFVLDLPIKEINEKSHYHVWYETIKQGRNIRKFVLWMEEKERQEGKKKKIEIDAGKQDIYDKLIGERWGVSPDRAARLVRTYSRVRIERNIRYAYNNRQGKEANMGGWLVSCIEADHAGAQAEAQDAAKARAEEKQQAESAAAAAAIRAENNELLGQDLFKDLAEESVTEKPSKEQLLQAYYAKYGKA